MTGVLAVPALAAAEPAYPGPTTPPQVEGTQVEGGQVQATTDGGEPAAVLGEQTAKGQTLPMTGGDIAGLTVIGLGLVAGGTVLVRRSRSAAQTPSPA